MNQWRMRKRCVLVNLLGFAVPFGSLFAPFSAWGGEVAVTGRRDNHPQQAENGVQTSIESETPPVETEVSTSAPSFEVKTRIHIRWELIHERTQPSLAPESNSLENEFLVRRARLKFLWKPTQWVMGMLQVGVEREFELGSSLLVDAYLHIAPLPYLELRVGQFKKPFSGLELRSSGKLKVLERGLGNERIVEGLLYGERDLGFQLSGRIVPKFELDYAVGVFNGSGPDVADRGNSKDIVARLTLGPLEQLQLGLSGSVKFFDKRYSPSELGWAVAADVRFRIKGLSLFLEGMMALDHLYWRRDNPADSAPIILSGVVIAAYRFRISSALRFSLEPAFKFEILDPSADIVDDEVYLYGLGLNTYLGKYLRLMVHAEFRRSQRNSRGEYPDGEVLMVQFCFDF